MENNFECYKARRKKEVLAGGYIMKEGFILNIHKKFVATHIRTGSKR